MKKTAALIILFVTLSQYLHAQKGEASISAGPLLSFPLPKHRAASGLNPGFGAEAMGQYNISNKGALLLQATVANYGVRDRLNGYPTSRITLFSLRGGYKHQLGESGFYVNGLVGIDRETDGFSMISFALGAGKRFKVKDDYTIDAGVDFIDGDGEARLNIKALITLFRKS